MTSVVVYEGGLRTTCTHLQSQSYIETDAPTDNHGRGERFSPTDLMATSLATCMLTVMGIKAQSIGLELDGLKTEVQKIMKADPRRVGGIHIWFHIPENLHNILDKDKAVLKNTAHTCPVAKSIHPDIDVQVDWGAWR